MEILNNVISSQGNQDNPDSQLDSDLAIKSQYKFRKEQRENKYDSDLEQKINEKKIINTDSEQNRTTNETHDNYTRATLEDNNNAIDYEDKEDDDL